MPIGQRSTCPFCGIYLETFITPRGKGEAKVRRPYSKATLMSFLSIALAVVFMCILIPVMTRANRISAMTAIEESFQELYGHGGAFTEEAWEMRLASFSASVANYERSYPRDADGIERIKRQLDMLVGFDPDTGYYIGGTDQDRRNQELIRIAQNEIIDLTDISFTPPDGAGNSTLTVQLHNSSELIISEIRMAFVAFDSFGNPSNGSKRGDNHWFVRANTPLRPGDEEAFLFSEAWNGDMAEIKILWMVVEYGPNFSIYLPPAVCEALWRY
jgi:hypothetical protein